VRSTWRGSAIVLLIGLFTPPVAAEQPSAAALHEAASKHYRQDHLDKAVELFSQVVREYPESPLAEQAANLCLDSLNLLKRWDLLLEHAREFLGNDKLVRSASFTAMLETLIAQAQFKLADEHFRAGRFDAAARGYVALVDEQPTASLADKALFNAAICFERAGSPTGSITAYERLIAMHPKSALAERSLYATAVLHERLAYFDHAARAYERLAHEFPDSEHAADAMLSAAILHEAAGRHEDAVRLLSGFAERFPDHPSGPSALRWAGDILRDTDETEQALATYRDWLKRFGRKEPDQAWTVRLEVSKLLRARVDLADVRDGVDVQNMILLRAEQQGTEAPQQLLAAAAELSFELAAGPAEAARAMELDPTGYFTLHDSLKRRADRWPTKLLESIPKLHQPEWTIAVLFMYAEIIRDTAEKLGRVPPGRLENPDPGVSGWGVEESADIGKAVSRYEELLREARKLGVYSDWTQKALTRLHELDPKNYPGLPEIRPEVAALYIAIQAPQRYGDRYGDGGASSPGSTGDGGASLGSGGHSRSATKGAITRATSE